MLFLLDEITGGFFINFNSIIIPIFFQVDFSKNIVTEKVFHVTMHLSPKLTKEVRRL